MQEFVIRVLLAASVISKPVRASVIEADSDSFSQLIESDLTFVEFYAPWCMHCQQMAPELDRAADRLKGSANIAKIDATQNEELARKYGVEGFPTLLIFHEKKVIPYKGGRTTNDIVSFIKKLLAPSYIILKTPKEIRNFEKGKQIKLIYYSHSDDATEKHAFLEYANANRDSFSYAMVTNTTLFSNREKDFIELHKPFDNKKSVLEDVTESSLRKWLVVEGFRIFDEIGAGNYDTYMKRGLPIAWLLIETLDKGSKEALEVARRVAPDFKGIMSFVFLDVTKFPALIEQFGLYDCEYPSFLIANSKQETFRFPASTAINQNEIRRFCSEFLDGRVTRTMRSQPLPKEDRNDHLQIIVGNTFDELVLNAQNDILICFTVPWCTKCQELIPVLSEISRRFSEDSELKIALIDISKNDIIADSFLFDSLPGIFLKPRGREPIIYQGSRSENDLLEFVMKTRGRGNEAEL